ncbi:MAG: 23S rRNA (uracil(1939)-C(5))-methyltransferase RlmD [Pseudomonas sp.]
MAKRQTGLRFQPSSGARSTSVPVGMKQRLEITRLAHDGRGIAHEAGRTWFVAGALPSEQVEARVLAARSTVVEARLERLFVTSPERRSPPCALAGQCGGCTVQHLPHAQQMALKQEALASQLQRVAAVVPEEWAAPLVGSELGYRRRARVAVRWDVKGRHLEVGFRAASSQSIVGIEHCPVLVPALQPVFAALPAQLRALQRPAAIGHVELFAGTHVALLVRHTKPLTAEDQHALRAFCTEQGLQLWWQGEGAPQPDDSKAVLSFQILQNSLTLAYQPGDFVQVNEAVNEQMIVQALAWLAPQPHERVLDLFCGLGNFSLPLAQRVRQVVGVEAVREMVERARDNAQANALNNVQFYQADLSEFTVNAPWAQTAFDAVLLDPPRDGAAGVVEKIRALGARRVLYVSCNPATLARDAASLAAQGYRLKRAGILDMFPQTAHVEAMALFELGE